MEFFLHFWDELDDIAAACRHLTMSAVDEVANVSGAGGTAVLAFTLSLLRLLS